MCVLEVYVQLAPMDWMAAKKIMQYLKDTLNTRMHKDRGKVIDEDVLRSSVFSREVCD